MKKYYEKLENKAQWVRCQILEMIASARKGHIGGAFSSTDILVALYYGGILNYDSKNPKWGQRDRFLMSKGHSAIAQYAILADLGFFPKKELELFCKQGILGGHPDSKIPGIEADTGSLGHGLGIASGMALAAKLDNKKYKTIVVLGDGECYEGSVWEAANFAAHHELNNLVAIVDRNMQGVTDFTEDSNRLEPFSQKWKAFGWDVKEINGHSFEEILDALKDIRENKSKKPLAIIAKTTKGKGVSYMECNIPWHHSVPSGENLKTARKELKSEVRA